MRPSTIIAFGGTAAQLRRTKQAVDPENRLILLPAETELPLPPSAPLPDGFLLLGAAVNDRLLDLLRALQVYYPGRPCIVITGKATRQEIIRLFRLGVADLLLEPTEIEVLRHTFRDHLEHYHRSGGLLRRASAVIRRLFRRRIPAQRRQPAYDRPAEAFGIIATPAPDIAEAALPGNTDLHLRLLGPLEVRYKGRLLKKRPGKKILSLLSFLLYHHDKPVHREILMERFWADHAPASARNSLNVAIHQLRKLFQGICSGQDIILFENECYVVNPQLEVYSDVDQFNYLWQKGQLIEKRQGPEAALGAYQKAVSLYRGDLLQDLPYEEWCESERENLKDRYLMLLERLSLHFFEEGNYTVAANICKRILEQDNCLENAHRRLIICYDRLAQRDRAIRQYQRCAKALREELGIDPSRETNELFLTISEKSAP